MAVGALADRHGPRVMLVVTVLLAGTAFALVGAVGALWQLFVLVGILGGIGMSSFYLLSAATVTHWFDAQRGLALALVFVGFNLGYVAGGPLAAALIDAHGWRAAYAMLGGGAGVVTMLAALTVRLPRGAEATAGAAGARRAARGAHPAGATLRDALLDRRQWYLNGSWLLMGGLAFMVNVHIVSFARDTGIGLGEASFALTAYGIGSAGGRLLGGVISDRVGAVATQRAAFLLTALALVGVRLAPSHLVLLAALVAFGAGFAATDTIVARVVPDLFGVLAIGSIMGVLALGWRAGAAVGPAAAGLVHDLTGSYALPFGIAPVVVLASWGFFALATSRPVTARRAR